MSIAAYKPQGTRHKALSSIFNGALSSIGYFEKKPTLAVAVSGGADSLALLLLADEWARGRGGKTIALTVDHGLRKESAQEAKQVAAWCKSLGIEHHSLKWTSAKPSSAIQAKAREVRYGLLTGWCKKNKVLHLLTAHHQNDQAETLLFRLARGSFLEGLACMPIVSLREGVRLIRPLLGVSKSSLERFLLERNQQWIEDPSNQNPHYTRNRIRNYVSDSAAAQAGALASRLGAIRFQLEHRLAAAMVHAVNIYPGHAVLKIKAFKKLPAEQAIRLLSALLSTLGNLPMPPRTEQVALLYHDLTADMPPKRRALAGCQFHYQAKYCRFRVESPPAAPHMNSGVKPAKPLAGGAFFSLNTVYA